jgi:hypothetical protein
VFLDHGSLRDDLAARGLASCLVCGSESTEIDPQLFPLRSMKPDDLPSEPSGLSQLAALLVCRDCGFIRMHAVTTAEKTAPDEPL